MAVSPAMRLLKTVWGHNCDSTPHSWERVNHSMRAALHLAISGGLRFSKDDFSRLPDFRCGYWIGDDGGEWAYALAVCAQSKSACESFEAWRDRQPIIADDVKADVYGAHHLGSTSRQRERLAVGFTFSYAGYRPKVTSFKDDAVVACTYKTPREGKVHKRFTITRDDIIADRADRKWRDVIVNDTEQLNGRETEFLDALGISKREEFYRVPRRKIERVLKSFGIA